MRVALFTTQLYSFTITKLKKKVKLVNCIIVKFKMV